jgi:excinuclease ABC subunit A
MTKYSQDDGITVIGARENNLKDITLSIPRNKMTVITGLSGSGKSTLAFDTIYAEGQRRYVEGLSAYARNFLEQLKKPEVDSITGLSPAIAIDQKSVSHSPRSTVGTVTEIYDFLRLLFARVGKPHCPTHNIPVESQTPQVIVDDIMNLPEGTKFMVLAPMASGKKGEFLNEFQKWLKKGFVRAKVDGEFIELESAKKLAKTKTHDIDLVIDRLILKKDIRRRLSESVQNAITQSQGHVVIELINGQRKSYSIHSACPTCGFSFPNMEPRYFSFNNPRGACTECHGLGTLDIEEHENIGEEGEAKKVQGVSYTVKKKRPVGTEEDPTEDSDDDLSLVDLSICPACQGSRLKPETLSVFIQGKNIAQFASLAATDLIHELKHLKFSNRDAAIAEKIIEQIQSRLDYLIRVGVGYLSVDRSTRTLSGGESQRIRLASQVGSSLVGVLYVLDEPSIGLHPRDHDRLLEILKDLRDLGNTVLIVEHDEDTIMAADHVIDIGPRAGVLGGAVIASGTPDEVANNPKSVTGAYLSGRIPVVKRTERRQGHGLNLELLGAKGNNLNNVDLKVPLGTLTTITGVSGSGKSTLIIDTLYKALANHFYSSGWSPAPHKTIKGLEHLDRVIEINQKPIGRTPRSNPATYTGLFPLIRDLYSQVPEAKMRGFKPGRFSFNVKGGRCEGCQGAGMVRVEMHFMSDVFVLCDVCGGQRYNRETLTVRYRDKTIADVLNMSVEEALEFFKNHAVIHRKLETLHKTGLDYIRLGQSSTTLSGGEAQRIKLAKELSKRATGRTFYILDEPTTGLHFADVSKLIDLLQGLVDQGNTVVVIEHNLDVIGASDHVIDLGPDAGRLGGSIVAEGTPEQISKTSKSVTGQYMKKYFARSQNSTNKKISEIVSDL